MTDLLTEVNSKSNTLDLGRETMTTMRPPGSELPWGGLSVWGSQVPAIGVGFRSAGPARVIPLLPGCVHRGHHLGQKPIVGVVRSDEKHFFTRLFNGCLYSVALRHAGIGTSRT